MEEGTFTVLSTDVLVDTPNVEAGTVSKIEISADPLMMNSPSEYTFTFRPADIVPEGGSIVVEFPSDYQGLD